MFILISGDRVGPNLNTPLTTSHHVRLSEARYFIVALLPMSRRKRIFVVSWYKPGGTSCVLRPIRRVGWNVQGRAGPSPAPWRLTLLPVALQGMRRPRVTASRFSGVNGAAPTSPATPLWRRPCIEIRSVEMGTLLAWQDDILADMLCTDVLLISFT